MSKKPFICVWHEPKKAEGGLGAQLAEMMTDEGVEARTCSSHYVGHMGIIVREGTEKKALKLINKLR